MRFDGSGRSDISQLDGVLAQQGSEPVFLCCHFVRYSRADYVKACRLKIGTHNRPLIFSLWLDTSGCISYTMYAQLYVAGNPVGSGTT